MPVDFVSLIRGQFTFTPDSAWTLPALPNVVGDGQDKSALLTPRSARLGHAVEVDFQLTRTLAMECHACGRRVLVLGTGEYQFPAAQLALELEAHNLQVFWSATTRSPILPGLAIGHALACADNVGDGIPNYLYNVDPGDYDVILVTYEGRCRPDDALLAQLGPHARAVRLT